MLCRRRRVAARRSFLCEKRGLLSLAFYARAIDQKSDATSKGQGEQEIPRYSKCSFMQHTGRINSDNSAKG